MPRLKDKYLTEVIPAMMEKFQYKNIMEVLKLEKSCAQHGLRRLQRQL